MQNKTKGVSSSIVKMKAMTKENFRYNSNYLLNSGYKYVNYGKNNQLPQLLIDRAEYSPTHKSILNFKNTLIKGDGFIIKNSLESPIEQKRFRFNPEYSNNELLKRIVTDYTLFGGFALQIVWDNYGTNVASIYHVDFSEVRVGTKDINTKRVEFYYLSKKWDGSLEEKSVVAYNPENNIEFNKENPEQIYYFKEYKSGNEYYPIPDYFSAIDSITAEGELQNYYVKSIQKGFNASTGIFFAQEFDADVEVNLHKGFDNNYQGTDLDSPNLIMTGLGDIDKAVKIMPLTNDKNSDIFKTTDEKTTQKIITAHNIPSKLLVSYEGGGTLGGDGNELRVAFNFFNNTVISNYQQNIEDVLSELSNKTVKIVKKDIIPTTFSESILEKILTKNELRESIGYEPIDESPVQSENLVTKNDNNLNNNQ